jgi:hypothetical protein
MNWEPFVPILLKPKGQYRHLAFWPFVKHLENFFFSAQHRQLRPHKEAASGLEESDQFQSATAPAAA